MNSDFQKAFNELGFVESPVNKSDYYTTNGYSFYSIKYEGYAYVLYKDYLITNKMHRLPIAHFQDADKFKTFFEILTEEL